MAREYNSSVYVWGNNANELLGCSGCGNKPTSSSKVQLVPRKLPPCCVEVCSSKARKDVGSAYPCEVSAGNGFSTVVTDKWKAFSWGKPSIDSTGFNAKKQNGYKAGKDSGSGSATSRKCQSMSKIKLDNVTSISHGIAGNYSVAVTLNGEIYGWGDNSHGNLGCLGQTSTASVGQAQGTVGHSNNFNARHLNLGGSSRKKIISEPKKISLPHLEENNQKLKNGNNSNRKGDTRKNYVKKVACGERHTCVLLLDGTLFSMGTNDAGQLGIGQNHNQSKGPSLKSSTKGAIHIIQAFRTSSQTIHDSQHTNQGEPSQNQTMTPASSPLNKINFRDISCGTNHCAAISYQDGMVFTWGWGGSGRLGHGDEAMRNEPHLVESLTERGPYRVIACGSAHTLVANERGDVFGFGWNEHGQISTSKLDKTCRDESSLPDCLLPVVCMEMREICMLSCGFAHSAAVSSVGNLYTWGMNEDGQCGIGHECPVLSPAQVDIPEKENERFVVSVSCGHSHTVCIVSNYHPLESLERFQRLQKYPTSAQIITRFARYALFRIRLTNVLKSKHAVEIEASSVDKSSSTEPSEIEPLPDDESSSISSYSSFECNLNTETNSQKDELAQRLIEMQQMSDEDHRSQVAMAHVRALRDQAIDKERRAIEAKQAEIECNLMHQEDCLSQLARSKLRKETKQVKQRVTPKRKMKAVDRDTRANDQIQKAANRLKSAREKREQQAKAKAVLPPITTKKERKPMMEKKDNQRKPVDNEPQNALELSRLERRKKLVKRRDKRLKTKEQMEKEAAIALQRKLIAKHEAERVMHHMTRMKLEEEMAREKELQRRRLLTKSAELQRLEKDLGMSKTLRQLKGENKENESQQQFWDVNHWTKNLSGIT